jgi:large subunit ribosomal protein L35
MFRQVWDEDVSAIYKDILGRSEPKYGREKKMTKYDAMKMSKRYISPADSLSA